MKVIPLLCLCLLASCWDRSKWDGAAVVHICRDGTEVYRLKSGELRTAWGQLVEDVERVCNQTLDPKKAKPR